jgi:hypothetical protein
MPAKVGLITDVDREAIVAGFKSIEIDIEAGHFVFDESLEDVQMVVEDALLSQLPGRFPLQGLPTGEMMVPEETIPFLAVKDIHFLVKGPANSETSESILTLRFT